MCKRIVALALALASLTLLALSGSALAAEQASGRAIVSTEVKHPMLESRQTAAPLPIAA